MENSYEVKKSNGRGGWQWRCPKGFTHYNFQTEKAATEDMERHMKRKEVDE